MTGDEAIEVCSESGLLLSHVAELQKWLHDAPHVDDGGETFLRNLVSALRARGLPIWRANVCLMTMHPEVFWRTVQWQEGQEGEEIHVFAREHALLVSPYYTASPVAALRQGTPAIRVRLAPGALPYPVCEDLRAQGATDYLAQGLVFSNGEISYASWATRDAAGFDEESCAALAQLAPYIARRVELESAYYATRSLLEVYLGKNAARRVLAGAFRRGEGETLDAAIWFCDLRDFTRTSDSAPPREVVQMLDAYFDRVSTAITGHGGEVLKFVGDAVLAIFPVAAAGDAQRACRSALAAAKEALVAIDALSRERIAAGRGELHVGVALHLGQVMYGNIGARDRLDFTVISSSVNEASRLEGLCKVLHTPLTLSEAFVTAAAAEGVVDLGAHDLKGVSNKVRVFSLAPSALR
jgi:adenylate cyclase